MRGHKNPGPIQRAQNTPRGGDKQREKKAFIWIVKKMGNEDNQGQRQQTRAEGEKDELGATGPDALLRNGQTS